MKFFNALARYAWAGASAARARASGVWKLRQLRGRQSSLPSAPRTPGLAIGDQGGPASAEPPAVDPSLPQLEVARDPQLMRDVFQRHLQPLGEEAYQVRECLISHTRYLPANRCMLQYTLRLTEPGTGGELSQWVTGTMYAGGQTQRTWKKLRRSDLGRRIPGASSTFVPFCYIPDLDMLVQVFPYDRRLPALPFIMAGPPSELEPLLLARFGPGDWQAEDWNIEPVRYLAEKRATLRLTVRAQDVATGLTEEKHFYAKVYRDEQIGEQTYQALRALWEKADARGVGFTVGRPIAYLSSLGILVQEEVTGTPLENVLCREDEAIPVVREVARALATLHLDCVVPPRRYRLRDEVAALKRMGKLLRQACPHLRSEIEEVVGAVAAGLEEVPPSPTHGDLKPVHIVLDGEHLTLLDLDDFTGADPIRDVARLLVFLARAPTSSSFLHDRPQAIAQAFVEEYFAHVPEAWRGRLPFHYAAARLKLATGTLRHQSPGWVDKIEAMIEEAKTSLAGRLW